MKCRQNHKKTGEVWAIFPKLQFHWTFPFKNGRLLYTAIFSPPAEMCPPVKVSCLRKEGEGAVEVELLVDGREDLVKAGELGEPARTLGSWTLHTGIVKLSIFMF